MTADCNKHRAHANKTGCYKQKQKTNPRGITRAAQTLKLDRPVARNVTKLKNIKTAWFIDV